MWDDSPPLARTKSDAHWGAPLLAALAFILCPAQVLRAEDGAPPRVMHFCWTNCFTLVFDNGLYRRADGSDETWTVDSFTLTSFALQRHDAPSKWNGFHTAVAYQGQVSNDQLVNVTVNGNPVPDINIAWGAALDTLPGSNEERDQRKSASLPPPEDANFASVSDASATEAPPPLLNYDQPPCPEDGNLWTPGYWSWGAVGYYWVPGAWVQPPRVGLLWTPGYWAFAGTLYAFHAGYWGPHIGYYGGINYGYGYVGSGFVGGRWQGSSFVYNRAVSNVNTVVIRNTYNETVINHVTVNRVSFNGPGGSAAAPTAEERATLTEPHIQATPQQRQILEQSSRNPELSAHAFGNRPVVSKSPPPAPVAPARPRAAPVSTVATQRSVVHAAPNTSVHPQTLVAQPSATNTTRPPPEARTPAPKSTSATPTKAQHPKQ